MTLNEVNSYTISIHFHTLPTHPPLGTTGFLTYKAYNTNGIASA